MSRALSNFLGPLLVLCGLVNVASAQESPVGASQVSPAVPATSSSSACPAQDRDEIGRALEREEELLERLEAQRSLTAPVVTMAIGYGGALVLGNFAIEMNEWQSPMSPTLLGASALFLAGGIGGHVWLTRRVRARRAVLPDLIAHRARRGELLLQLELAKQGGCSSNSVQVLDAKHAQLEQIERRLQELEREAASHSLVAPAVVMGGGFVVSLLSAGAALVIVLYEVVHYQDYERDEIPHRLTTWERALGATALGGAVIGLGGAIWFRAESKARKKLRPEAKALRARKRDLETLLLPAVGPQTVGLSLRVRF